LLLGLGLGTAAFFWLPVYGERNAVNLNTLLGAGDNYDFRTHFLSLYELFAPSLRLDWGASQPDFRFNLGVAQWLLAGLGLLSLGAPRARGRGQTGFFALTGLVLLFLMLPASVFVWEMVPFLPFFQFPWRLLGPAAVVTAVLAGAGVSALQPYLRHNFVYLTAGAVLLPLLLGLPLSQPAPWEEFGDVNMLRMTLIENSGRWLGTTSTSDYVPATVDVIPQRVGSVVAGIGEGKPFDRVNWAVVPEGATVDVERVRPLLTRYHVQTPKNFRLRLFQFDFPGWEVRVDGELIEKEVGRPEGFLVIPVTAGEHEVEVRFGSTPVRRTAVWLTWLSLLGTMLAALGWNRGGEIQVDKETAEQSTGEKWWVVPTAVAVFTLLFAGLLNPLGWLRLESADYVALPAEQQLFADFGEQIALIGFSSNKESARPGDLVHLTLYWQAQDELPINYQVFVHLRAADGFVVAQSDKINPGDFPTRRWSLETYVRDEHYLLIPEGLRPGEYSLSTGLWVQDDGWRLPVLDADLQQIADNQPLMMLTVTE
jgi:hypothetical protein